MTKIKQAICKWLGLTNIARQSDLESLQRSFNDQMAMVGVDVHLRGRDVQTMVIFISRLGNQGGGTVKIVDMTFGSISQLQEFATWCERTYKAPSVWDVPGYINDMIHGSWR